VEEPLRRIAGVSRELVDSISEIVWAVNPRKDRFRDLAQHMREFAGDVFAAQDIKFQFQAAAREQDLKLGMEARRQVLGEVERVDGVLRLQARHLHPPFDGAAAPGLQFQIGQPLQGGRQAKILAGRVSDGLIQMTAHRRQAELFEFLGECNHRVVSFQGK
jgi:hypothetical protein